MRSKIVILQTNMSGLAQLVTMTVYSSELSEKAEADKLYRSNNTPHSDWLTPDTVLAFLGRYII